MLADEFSGELVVGIQDPDWANDTLPDIGQDRLTYKGRGRMLGIVPLTIRFNICMLGRKRS
jgi:hypothetical protein